MKKIIVLLMSMLTVTPAHSNDAVWFIGGLFTGQVINNMNRPRDVIIVQQPPIIVQQPRQYGGNVVYRQQSPIAPGQPYMIIQAHEPINAIPPSFINGGAYCPPGSILYQRVMPYGNVENAGCSR